MPELKGYVNNVYGELGFYKLVRIQEQLVVRKRQVL
jgi:hypothetical protein